jgi:hypothetical protein
MQNKMSEENLIEGKCFICQKKTFEKIHITIEDGGKLHDQENKEEDMEFICLNHLKEYETLKKKRTTTKDDFY